MTAKTECFSVFIDLPTERQEALMKAKEVPVWLLELLNSPQHPWAFEGLRPQGMVSVARNAQVEHGGVLIDGALARLQGALLHVSPDGSFLRLYRSHKGIEDFYDFVKTRRMKTPREEIESLLR